MFLKNKLKKFFSSLFILSTLLFIGFTGEKEKVLKTNYYQTDAYHLKLDRFELPFTNNGILADVRIPPYSYSAKFDTLTVIFSGGFFLGGYIYPGTPYERLWINGVQTTYRVEDYYPGIVGMDRNNPDAKIYIVQSSDQPFSQSWQEWKKAVELGADFYDGDDDGVYNPVDKNENGKWDSDEDKPNLIGDFTAWCVYNDGVPTSSRHFFTSVPPLGIEIQQTLWAYKTIPKLANCVFIRYRITYKGSNQFPDVNRLDSVIFSFANDFDLGGYMDDLLGTDTLLQANYCYNDGSDDEFGNNPPVIMAQLLQGPYAFIPNVSFVDANGNGIFDSGETPITSAKEFIGENKIREIQGAINLNISSSNSLFSGIPEYPEYAFWNLIQGYTPSGKKYNPCTFEYGVVVGGVNCNQVNPMFVFSGDPVTNKGWLNNVVHDVRGFLNVGKFVLEKNKPVDIIVAYAVGRGSDPINSIVQARRAASTNTSIYNLNFVSTVPLPETELRARSFENRIDVFWQTANDFQFKNFLTTSQNDTLLNVEFEAYELWAHSTPEIYYGPDTNRSKKIAAFDVRNDIEKLYYVDDDGISIKQVFSNYTQLEPKLYSNSNSGYLMVSLTKNPFTNKQLNKGERLYFSLRKLYLNKTSSDLVQIQNKPRNYLLTSYKFGLKEKVSDLYEFRVGEDFNAPINLEAKTIPSLTNITESEVVFEEIDNSQLTDDDYQLSFFLDRSGDGYSMFWRMKNLTKNRILLDSQKFYYNIDSTRVVIDGLSPKIKWIDPEIKKEIYNPEKNKWFKDFREEISGIFYTGPESVKGISSQIIRTLSTLGMKKSYLTTFDKLRRIEIRFGPTQKAYRFVSDNLGLRFWSAARTAGQPNVGYPGEYFVEVPFQVWIKDDRYKEEIQLACGFIESVLRGGNPDGEWDPGVDIVSTKEYIIIFNQPYDPDGKQMEYVGYLPTTGTKVYAKLDGWDPPVEANFSTEQINRAKSPWFDALLVIGLERSSVDSFYNSGDILTIPISYVITERDTFYYKSKSKLNKLTLNERKELVKKINVFPNPYFGWEDFRAVKSGVITFSNLPEEVTIKIYTLSGNLIRTLTENDKITITSPFIEWDLRNEKGMKVADGVYLAHVKTKFGDKVLKFSIVKQRK
ncbi:MAG: hypothetical protein ACPL25_00705 [Ignavibacteria bacterium]